nr:uncharacterized protein LOC129448268 [Misgurnus anguillicaudatus]
MDHKKHGVQHGAEKAAEWKDESLIKGKGLDDKKRWNDAGLCDLDLKIRMEVGLIGNMDAKKEIQDGKKQPQFKTDTKGQSRIIDGSKMQSCTKIPCEETTKEESVGQLNVSDYLVLLKSLRISLPKGVLNPKVIELSHTADMIQKAKDIVKDLENFELQFNSVPRLGCREVKNSLALKNNGKVLETAKMIFFEKVKDLEKTLAKWWENKSNTACRFRFRDKYKTVAISTPAMYATTETRSWKHLEVGENLANVCEGTAVRVRDIENRQYCDESTLETYSPCPERFGKFFQNPADELECLKFLHELGEIGNNKRVSYTKNIKVDFGFLSGRLDFLAEVTDSRAKGKAKGTESEKFVIECKGTTGDMVGKLFTKPENGGRRALLIKKHECYYQVQAYMYILNRSAKQTQTFTSDRAVMVIRHYHKNGEKPRDFYWNYMEKNAEVQQQIDELCAFCQEDVLACFLAVLNLIFQLEK